MVRLSGFYRDLRYTWWWFIIKIRYCNIFPLFRICKCHRERCLCRRKTLLMQRTGSIVLDTVYLFIVWNSGDILFNSPHGGIRQCTFLERNLYNFVVIRSKPLICTASKEYIFISRKMISDYINLFQCNGCKVENK